MCSEPLELGVTRKMLSYVSGRAYLSICEKLQYVQTHNYYKGKYQNADLPTIRPETPRLYYHSDCHQQIMRTKIYKPVEKDRRIKENAAEVADMPAEERLHDQDNVENNDEDTVENDEDENDQDNDPTWNPLTEHEQTLR